MKYFTKGASELSWWCCFCSPSFRKPSSAGSCTTQPTTPTQSCVTANSSSNLLNSGNYQQVLNSTTLLCRCHGICRICPRGIAQRFPNGVPSRQMTSTETRPDGSAR